MFQGLDWHSQLLLGLWTSWKCNLMKSKKWWSQLSNVTLKSFFAFGPTENATFFKLIKRRSTGKWHLKVIFCLLIDPKFDFGDVEKALFQVVANHRELFSSLDKTKMRLCKVEKATFQGVACHFEHIFSLLANPKCDLGEVEKAMFLRLAWHFQFILGPGLAQNAIWMKSKKRWFRLLNVSLK